MPFLDGLSGLTCDLKYRQAAEATASHVMNHLTAPNGLIYCGDHVVILLTGGC